MIKTLLATLLMAVAPIWQSSAQYTNYATHGDDGQFYHWNADAWCPTHGPQTIWVKNNDDWGVTTTETFNTDCWVQTYPHIGWWGGDHVSHYKGLYVEETEYGPVPPKGLYLQWEAAFDIWLNSSPGADLGYEIMIWTDTHNVSPAGRVLATPVIDGVRYKFYQGEGGNGPASWFVREGNTNHTALNVSDFINYVAAHHGPRNPVVDTVEFGWEVWGTQNTSDSFVCTQFTLSGRGYVP